MDKHEKVKHLLDMSRAAAKMSEEDLLCSEALEVAGLASDWRRGQAEMFAKRSDAYLNHAMRIACEETGDEVRCEMDKPKQWGNSDTVI